MDCALEGTTSAECTLSASGSLFSDYVTSSTYTGTGVVYDTVLITAGAATATTTSSKGSLAPGNKGSITGSVGPTGTATAKTGTSTSAKTQSSNVALQGSPALGAGIIGALGVAVAGAIL